MVPANVIVNGSCCSPLFLSKTRVFTIQLANNGKNAPKNREYVYINVGKDHAGHRGQGFVQHTTMGHGRRASGAPAGNAGAACSKKEGEEKKKKRRNTL